MCKLTTKLEPSSSRTRLHYHAGEVSAKQRHRGTTSDEHVWAMDARGTRAPADPLIAPVLLWRGTTSDAQVSERTILCDVPVYRRGPWDIRLTRISA